MAQPQAGLLEEGVEQLTRAQPEPVQQIAGVSVQPAHPRLPGVDGVGGGRGVLLAGDDGLPGPGLRREAVRTAAHSMPHGPVGNNY
ncbi:hypothetical protein SY2F82_40880 [Streptomyces sp. Y2F8-2]|nr:hypothetical protein SY2F82_40880 [Streptomyces sp. Y2F8-2]